MSCGISEGEMFIYLGVGVSVNKHFHVCELFQMLTTYLTLTIQEWEMTKRMLSSFYITEGIWGVTLVGH